jgi:two-component system, NarL family, response regulator LiaR
MPVTPGEAGGRRRVRPLRVLIADDDPLARRAIRGALETRTEFEICGEAATGEEAIRLASSSDPDVVVMDVTMPGLDGIAATRRILRASPESKIVVFSATSDDELALLSLRAGAWGYLTKGIDLAALPRVLRRVQDGEAAIPRALATKLVQRFRLLPDHSEGMRPVRSDLTAREWEVLDLLCADRTTAQIAGDLEMSVETVRSHVKHILRKLGVHSRAEAVAVAEGMRQPLLRTPSVGRGEGEASAGAGENPASPRPSG